MKKKLGYGLIRVSTLEQDTFSQKYDLQKKANELGYDIPENCWFEEKISGYDEDYDKDRESIVKLRERIAIERPDAIFVWELSRLSRRAIKIQKYIPEFSLNAHIPLYVMEYDMWTIDPKTGKIIDDNVNTLYGAAKGVEKERERITARFKRGRDANAEKGLYVGHLVDGYTVGLISGRKHIIIDENRRKVIEDIFDMYVNKGWSCGEIRDYLNAEDIPTANRYRFLTGFYKGGYRQSYKRLGEIVDRDDARWTDSQVSDYLSEKWYIGQRTYNGKTYTVDRIISDDMWERAQMELAKKRFQFSTATRKYMLTGLLFCGKCGKKMYGHGDEYNNMYYCSSKEYGTKSKCGLRWIRQENLESIIWDIIRRMTQVDMLQNIDSPFTRFFSPDENKVKSITSQIKIYQKLISREEADIIVAKQKITFFVKEQGKYLSQPSIRDSYGEQIESANAEIKKHEENIINHRISIDKLKKQKKSLSQIEKKFKELDVINDFDTAKDFIHSVISRIVLFNPDAQCSIIRIYFVNGKRLEVIYSPDRLHKQYLPIFAPYFANSEPKYDEQANAIVFTGHKLFFENAPVYFGGEVNEENVRHVVSGLCRTVNGTLSYESLKEIYLRGGYDELDPIDKLSYKSCFDVLDEAFCTEEAIKAKGKAIYSDSIPVLEFTNELRHSKSCFPFADLHPLSEKGQIRRDYNRQLLKKYNTGKPSFTPFVVKDVNYEDISKQRKHLYNRRYKILNNKHLTPEQKDAKLQEIAEKLEAFKYQLKYLPSNKKGEDMLRRYNNTSTMVADAQDTPDK